MGCFKGTVYSSETVYACSISSGESLGLALHYTTFAMASGEVAETLMGVAPSASAISRLNQSLTQQFEDWRQRALQEHWRVLYLDGVHFSIRHGDKADSTIILTALGVDLTGNKEVLALRACARCGQRWMGVSLARPAFTRRNAHRSHCDRWA